MVGGARNPPSRAGRLTARVSRSSWRIAGQRARRRHHESDATAGCRSLAAWSAGCAIPGIAWPDRPPHHKHRSTPRTGHRMRAATGATSPRRSRGSRVPLSHRRLARLSHACSYPGSFAAGAFRPDRTSASSGAADPGSLGGILHDCSYLVSRALALHKRMRASRSVPRRGAEDGIYSGAHFGCSPRSPGSPGGRLEERFWRSDSGIAGSVRGVGGDVGGGVQVADG